MSPRRKHTVEILERRKAMIDALIKFMKKHPKTAADASAKGVDGRVAHLFASSEHEQAFSQQKTAFIEALAGFSPSRFAARASPPILVSLIELTGRVAQVRERLLRANLGLRPRIRPTDSPLRYHD